MNNLLEEYGNENADSIRYHTVMRWYSKVLEDARYFAPDVTPLPELATTLPFDTLLSGLNDWWNVNFGSKTAHHVHGTSAHQERPHVQAPTESRNTRAPVPQQRVPQMQMPARGGYTGTYRRGF